MTVHQRWGLVAVLACAATLALMSQSPAADRLRFWNLTTVTIQELYMAPAGTTTWGANQCKNDRDDSVDDDERLLITNVASGTYDARMTYKNGNVCLAKSVKVVEGKIFSIEKKDLTNCTKP